MLELGLNKIKLQPKYGVTPLLLASCTTDTSYRTIANVTSFNYAVQLALSHQKANVKHWSQSLVTCRAPMLANGQMVMCLLTTGTFINLNLTRQKIQSKKRATLRPFLWLRVLRRFRWFYLLLPLFVHSLHQHVHSFKQSIFTSFQNHMYNKHPMCCEARLSWKYTRPASLMGDFDP